MKRGAEKVNVRRTLVKRYNRFTGKAVGTCLFLGALGVGFLVLAMESMFPPSTSYYRDNNRKELRDLLFDVLFHLPLYLMRLCGIPEKLIRVILVCAALGSFGGILGIVWWARRMRGRIPPAVKLKKGSN